MSKRKAEGDIDDSDSDQSVPDIFGSSDEKRHESCMDKSWLEIDEAKTIEKCAKFLSLLTFVFLVLRF